MKLKQLLLYSLLAPVALSPTLDARDQKTKKTHTKTQETDQELNLDSTDMVFIIVTALAATSVLGYIIYWKYYSAPKTEKVMEPPITVPLKTPATEPTIETPEEVPNKVPTTEPKKEQNEPGKPTNKKQESPKTPRTVADVKKIIEANSNGKKHDVSRFAEHTKHFLKKR